MAQADDFLRVGLEAAREAAGLLLAAVRDRGSLAVEAKGRGDVVTDVDRRAEQAIIARLREAFPDHGFLGEEGGASGTGEYRWIIDPIDGTLNFSRGYPHFCVSIALARGETPIAALVLDPVRDELFWALQGGGAWLNGAPLQVSGCTALEQALLGVVFPKPGSPLLARFLPGLERALAQAGGVRRSGSMVLDLAYVAAGRLDGFWEFGMQPWDIAAGALLVQEAGGWVAPLEGETRLLEAHSLYACTPALAPALRTLCRPD